MMSPIIVHSQISNTLVSEYTLEGYAPLQMQEGWKKSQRLWQSLL